MYLNKAREGGREGETEGEEVRSRDKKCKYTSRRGKEKGRGKMCCQREGGREGRTIGSRVEKREGEEEGGREIERDLLFAGALLRRIARGMVAPRREQLAGCVCVCAGERQRMCG